MPKGVYDRSKMRAKKDVEQSASPAPAPVGKKRGRKPKVAAEPALVVKPGQPIDANANHGELYTHLRYLTESRGALIGNSGHNEKLLALVDSELGETVKTLTRWRESTFPAPSAAAEVPTIGAAKTYQAPVPAPVPMPAPIAAPPLPFTPETVQNVLKQSQ